MKERWMVESIASAELQWAGVRQVLTFDMLGLDSSSQNTKHILQLIVHRLSYGYLQPGLTRMLTPISHPVLALRQPQYATD